MFKNMLFAALLIATIQSSGCATSPVIDSYCLLTEPHPFSDPAIDAMTLAEAEREADHNDQWRERCDI